MGSRNCSWIGSRGFLTWFLLVLSCTIIAVKASWGEPGCHRVRSSEPIRNPGCVEFVMETNACAGYCQSLAIPSSPSTILQNPRQNITSISQCCDIDETEDFIAVVSCIEGPQELIFKSAKTCICSGCMKD